MILEFINVEKSFGAKKVLKGVNFTAKSGVANGYLGRNGSGKTTSFRILLDIFKPDKGQILLDGKKLDHKKVKIGYLPEERGMYDGVGLVDQLTYFGMLKGMKKKAAQTEAKKWLEYFDLKDDKQALKTLSKGNAQKIQIIQSVMNDPDILVFDEPFSGLDPVNVSKLKEIINNFIKRDKLVLFSSHQMPVVETFCEDVHILEKGEIVLSGNLTLVEQHEAVLQHGFAALSVGDEGGREVALVELHTFGDVQPDRVHVEHAQGVVGHAAGDAAVGAYLGVVPNPAQQAVGNARRAARAAGDLVGAIFGDVGAQQPGRAQHDALKLVGLVELQPRDNAEAVTQRVGEHAGPGGGAHQGEGRDVELDGARRRPFADHDVDLEIFQRRVEDLFHYGRETVDLVDEEHVIAVEPGKQGRQVAGAITTASASSAWRT